MVYPPPPPIGVGPPPPPGPPVGMMPPPPGWTGYPGAMGYSGWMPAPPPGARTREAVASLLKAINMYLVYLSLTVIAGIIAAAVLDVVVLSSAGPFSGTLPRFGSSNPYATGSAFLGAAVLVGGLAVAAFVMLIVSWAFWRTGAENLEAAAGEYGPGPAEAAHRAQRDWVYTTVVFLVGLFVTIGIVAAVVFATITQTFGNLGSGNNSTIVPSALGMDLLAVGVAAAILGVLFSFLTYWFATAGLVGGLLPIASPTVRAQASSARSIILVGAVVAVVGSVGYFVPYGTLLSVVSPVIILYGFWKLRGAYVAWLAAPTPPGSIGVSVPH